MGVNSLPKTVTRQRRGGDLNPGPSAPESSTLTNRLPSHPAEVQLEVAILAESCLQCQSFNFSTLLRATLTDDRRGRRPTPKPATDLGASSEAQRRVGNSICLSPHLSPWQLTPTERRGIA